METQHHIDVTPKAVGKIREAFKKNGVTEGGLRLGVDHQLCRHLVADLPTDDATAPDV